MSLILEALRKSEAERRRGRAPDLHAELPPAPTRARRMPPNWLWIALATVLLLVALLWVRGRGGPARIGGAEGPTTSDAAPSTRELSEEPKPSAATSSPFPRVERIVAPRSGPAATGASADASATPAGAQDGRTAGMAAPTPAPGDTPPDLEPAQPVADAPPSPVRTPRRPPASATSPREVDRLAELAPEERRRLPPMRLSMHMWNEDPAQRFAIIDGQRYSEGDRIGDAVVDAIDDDGVVLDLDGRAVRVPLP